MNRLVCRDYYALALTSIDYKGCKDYLQTSSYDRGEVGMLTVVFLMVVDHEHIDSPVSKTTLH